MSTAQSYSNYDALQVELMPDGVVLATLDRPERLNAFNGAMRHSIRALLHQVRDDKNARALVITGAGRGFCSGADLTTEDRRTWPTEVYEPQFAWNLDLLHMPKPTIAAVNGVAAGGGLGLVFLCDIRICSTEARLLPLWLKRAIHPDDLVTWTLPRLVGYSRALKWMYLGDDIPLEEAKSSGLVSDVVPGDKLMEVTLELASQLAKGPTAHYSLAKQSVLMGLNRTPWDAVLMESWGQQKIRTFEDTEEGGKAFREQRAPEFKGQ